MPIVNQGWAYINASSSVTSPGGLDQDIQFNNHGAFSGSGLLTTDGTGSLSASVNISASAFYGDGTNLTGLTASAVNVADGPEYAIQFRKDSPVTGEISGSGDLMWITGSTDFLQVTGAVKVAGFISASTSVSASEFYVAGNTIYFGDGNTYKIGRNGTNLDINAGDSIVLNAGSGHVSASTNLSASSFYGDAAHISASAAAGSEVYFGTGTSRTIGTEIDEGDDFLVVGHSAGAVVISGNAGVEFVADTTAGVGSFGSPFFVYTTEEGDDVAAKMTHQGEVSASGPGYFGSIQTSGSVICNHNPSSSEGISNTPALWISASNPDYGGFGEIYGNIWFGSGSVGGMGFTGAAIGLSKFGPTEELSVESPNGGLLLRSDSGDTTVRAKGGEVILSASAGIIAQTAATFNNESANFNAGFNVNNAAGTFNDDLNAWGNTTIGNAHSDSLTVNASASFNNMGNINSSASNIVWQIHSGSNATGSGPGQNGPLLFFSSASTGNTDYLKFHTSTAGPGPAVVFPALTIFNNTISASSNVSGAFFYGDGSNLTNLPGGGGGGIFTELSPTQAATTSSVAIGKATAPEGVFQVSGSLEAGGNALVKVSGDGGNDIFVVTGSGRVGIGTAAPSRQLDLQGTSAAYMEFNATSHSRYTIGSEGSGFIIFDDTAAAGTAGYRLCISDTAATLGYIGIGKGLLSPKAQLHVSSSLDVSNNGVLRVDGDEHEGLLFVTGSGYVGIGTVTPDATLEVNSDGTGSTGARIDKSYSDTTANSNIAGLDIDFDKTGTSTSNNTMYGLNIDMDNTTATNGNNYMYGLNVTPTLTHAADAGGAFLYGANISAQGGTNGSSLTTGARIEAAGGDAVYGLQLDVEDGGVDLRIESSADAGDYFQIQTIAKGATTLSTVDDGGATADLTCSIDGDILLDPAGGKVTVDGNLYLNQYIYHKGDTDTFINFTDDDINITVGNINFMDLTQDTVSELTINESAQDLDVRIEGEADPNLFFTDASTSRVGIGTKTPSYKLHVSGTNTDARAVVASDSAVIDITPGSGPAIKFGTPADTDAYQVFGTFSSRHQIKLNSSLDFQISGSTGGVGYYFDQSEKVVGIRTNTPTATLTVAGSGSFSGSAADGDDLYFGSGTSRTLGTSLQDGDDYLVLAHTAGGIDVSASEGVTLITAPGGNISAYSQGDYNFQVADANMNMVFKATSAGNVTISSSADEMLLQAFGTRGAASVLAVTGAQGVGINTSSPRVALDVHYSGNLNPINLGDDKGGGEVVYFGTAGGDLAAGGLYYLDTDGAWKSTSASVTGSGHDQLLGVAMADGKPAAVGMLVKGYFHQDSYFSGSFGVGKPVYIQSSSVARSATEGGFMSGAAPTAADSYVRVIGYGTDTANVIYFNPDSTYVEIGS